MSEKAKYVLQRVLKYVVAIIASLCEAYVLFLLCIRFGIQGYRSIAIWVLAEFANLYALGFFPFTDKSAEAFSKSKKILSFLVNIIIMGIWGVSMHFGISIADGGIYQNEYCIISHMPFVEAYMHENDMLDGYYESVINGPFSTSEEVAWAEERLAD